MSAPDTPTAPQEQRTPRMTLSRVVELALQRGSSNRSHVVLSRDREGNAAFSVTVYADDSGEQVAVEEAETQARAIFDRLSQRYPITPPHADADVTLTRNAKGQPQFSATVKTDDAELQTIDAMVKRAHALYRELHDRLPFAAE